MLLMIGSSLKSPVIVGAMAGSWFLAQTTTTMDATPIIEKIAREGGFFALVLVLLYFYRRDTKWATEFWKDQAIANVEHAKEIAQIVKENTKSNTDVSNAVRESTVVMHQTKRIMATHLVNRRDEDA